MVPFPLIWVLHGLRGPLQPKTQSVRALARGASACWSSLHVGLLRGASGPWAMVRAPRCCSPEDRAVADGSALRQETGAAHPKRVGGSPGASSHQHLLSTHYVPAARSARGSDSSPRPHGVHSLIVKRQDWGGLRVTAQPGSSSSPPLITR